MPSPDPRPRSRTARPAALPSLALALLLALSPAARAQKADAVFDDEPAPARKADAKKAETKKDEAKPAEPAKKAEGDAPTRETIGFTQENVAAQMTELEERMFRLSEALRSLEPENASRLRLALKFSREELILEQMRETNGLLKEAQLAKAETEVRELLAKLEHLRTLLLAEDLDFQLKLARLRQIRETLGQLDRVSREQRRELGWTRFAIEQRKESERFAARRPGLAELVAGQESAVAELGVEEPDAAALRDREAKLRDAASALAADPTFAGLEPAHLGRAATDLGDAVAKLEAGEPGDAAKPAGAALESLRAELSRLDERSAEAGRSVAEAEFRRHESAQARTRVAADALAASSTRLGDAGVALQKDLIRAGASMKSAEESLAATAAPSAADDQSAALDALMKGAGDLGVSMERLLVELRTELQARLAAELGEMHEMQASIRETTEAQAVRAAQKSRTALIALANLSKREAELAERTEHLLALVEETEFGIALPTALRVLGREMRGIEGALKEGDAGERTVSRERRVEEDLLALLGAVRRLSPRTPPPPGSPLPSDLRERERELNRLVAELKMIRLLQVRLNDETAGVDKTRPEPPALPPELRKEVEALEATQDEIRESMARIAERLEAPSDDL